MIAEQARISQGLLYNYYASKDALLQEIFERSMEEVRDSLEQASGAATPQRALETLVRSAFETVSRNRAFWQLTYQLRMQPDVLAGLGEDVRLWSEAIRQRIEALLRNAGSSEAAAEARILFATIAGAAQHYVLDPEQYPLDQVAEQIIRRFLPPGVQYTPTMPREQSNEP
jgi:AcrR family transcriptional regulator